MTRSDILRGQSWRVAQADNSHSTRGGSVGKVPEQTVEKSVASDVVWSTCALSSQPLRPPIVADPLGRLYNRDAVVQFLLCKRDLVTDPEQLLAYANQLRVANGALDHLRSIKDVLEVHLTPAAHGSDGPAAAPAPGSSDGAGPSGSGAGAPSAAAVAGAGAGGSSSSGRGEGSGYVCPLTLLPCTRHPCSALRPCGHVLSDRALAQLAPSTKPPAKQQQRGDDKGESRAGAHGDGQGGSNGGVQGPAAAGVADVDRSCPVCGAAYDSVLPINGTAEQVAVLRAALKTAKPSKKRKAAEAADAVGA